MIKPKPWIRWLYTLALALIGGLLFKVAHLPIPWLLGPMIIIFIGSKLWPSMPPLWPGAARNAGMIIVGYSIGLSLTAATLQQIGGQLPSMIGLTTLLILFALLTAYIIFKISGVSFPTVLLGSIPGGLTQMVVLAEEVKGIDITVVTFLQVSRLMMIIIFVPLLIFSPIFGVDMEMVTQALEHSTASWNGLFPNIFLFAIACTGMALLGKKIHFPTAFILLPMITTAMIQFAGISAPVLPSVMLDIAQLLIGSSIGLMLKPELLTNKIQMIGLAIGSGIVLLLFACILAFILMKWHHVSPATAMLSMAPGGMDQMSIIAHEVGADIATVSCYQLFRTLFIFLAVPPLLKLIFRRIAR
ncbi:membrane AbrB-like protein [Paenibacillus sp. SORGH_AS306]|uniref:AbrB family transcriptional regulator n=1 Tax=unclassified Paenibacillus TaxID=185978 RepID=UPI00278900B8|nr:MULTISPECIES: AbrB family transcriptional regulator [unclassified Paenibacillus]MDQ1236984.1 membrane AbrB-like protein [Paenibacillus sp. SORGH_AS_0306]MDR6109345.1 membrane AbrB-like protein [Paenibacillus sp. SORGH_AS_0338]